MSIEVLFLILPQKDHRPLTNTKEKNIPQDKTQLMQKPNSTIMLNHMTMLCGQIL